ncbi:MAG: hypothetical protein KQI35_07220 [Bacteroidetes bacterium]|nr:hypothetical protein [Bacteroidota bacterium]
MEKYYKILVIFLISLLSLPALQYTSRLFPEKPLQGVTIEEAVPALSFASYYNFEFQMGLMKYIDQNFGFRPFFIRLFNQLQYSLFNIPHGHGVVIGKDNYLYEDWYIRDYLGDYFIGKDSIRKNVEKLELIQNYLHRHNTELLVILAPGKAYYYPEYIPDGYKKLKTPSNYSVYRSALDTSTIPTFDANGWFMQLKNERKEPLFTQTGTHWSEFGAKLVADSLLRLTAKVLNRPINTITITGAEWTTKLRSSDDDLAQLMNIFTTINRMEVPYAQFKRDTIVNDSTEKPSVIVISDSFFWNLYDGMLDHSFRDIEYWYYYSSIFPQSFRKKTFVSDIDLADRIEKTDLIVLMTSTAGLNKMGFGFIEEVFPIARNEQDILLDSLTHVFHALILDNTKELETIRMKAIRRNLPLDSMILLDARYLAGIKLKHIHDSLRLQTQEN